MQRKGMPLLLQPPEAESGIFLWGITTGIKVELNKL